MVNFQCKQQYDMDDLIKIMQLLRDPENGCPWDRAQTHQSIRANMLEEAYEAVDAIDEGNPAHLKEELGDVLLQVVFHAHMADEAGQFSFADVVDGVCQKLVFRHAHIFGKVKAEDEVAALAAWDTQKRVEKGQKTTGDTMSSVARALPALVRAEKIQSKAKKAGFDWQDVAPALDKLEEEVRELRTAIEQSTNEEEELGDVLFAAVKVGRFLGLESEQALQKSSEKFIARFRAMEQAAHCPLSELDLPALETLWQQAKAAQAGADKSAHNQNL